MNSLVKSLYVIAIIAVMASGVSIEAAVTKIVNQDAFTQELNEQKRIAVIVLDRSKFNEEVDAENALSNLDSIFNIVSNNKQYRLSKIGFAIVDFAYLPEATRTELVTAMGGKLNEPATLILFEQGALMVDIRKSISADDLFGKACDVIEDIEDEIEDAWGRYIEYVLHKRQRADARRAFAQAKKEQVALAQYQVDQQGYAVSEPVETQSASYDPALYGYGEQPAYATSDGSVYYNYPYYNGGVVPGVGVGVGLGIGAAAAYDNNYHRNDYRGERGNDYQSDRGGMRGGGMRGGGMRGGGMRGGGRGRR